MGIFHDSANGIDVWDSTGEAINTPGLSDFVWDETQATEQTQCIAVDDGVLVRNQCSDTIGYSCQVPFAGIHLKCMKNTLCTGMHLQIMFVFIEKVMKCWCL